MVNHTCGGRFRWPSIHNSLCILTNMHLKLRYDNRKHRLGRTERRQRAAKTRCQVSLLETTQGSVFEQQSLLLALLREEDPDYPSRLHPQNYSFTEASVKDAITGSQTDRGVATSSGRRNRPF